MDTIHKNKEAYIYIYIYTIVQKFGVTQNCPYFKYDFNIRKVVFNKDNQKYNLDIVNVVNDYSSWKRQIFYGISTSL